MSDVARYTHEDTNITSCGPFKKGQIYIESMAFSLSVICYAGTLEGPRASSGTPSGSPSLPALILS